ncbi:hypothetical protein Hanom_Chr01g00072771 [Helianthus anomalus]
MSRYAAETMRPGLEITGEVINCWAYILNEEEKRRSKGNKTPRFFCTIRMLVRSINAICLFYTNNICLMMFF